MWGPTSEAERGKYDSCKGISETGTGKMWAPI